MMRLDALFGEAGTPDDAPDVISDGRTADARGALHPPREPLASSHASFRARYGVERRLLATMAALGADDPAMSTLLAAIDRGLREGSFETEAAPEPPGTFMRYVYPVV